MSRTTMVRERALALGNERAHAVLAHVLTAEPFDGELHRLRVDHPEAAPPPSRRLGAPTSTLVEVEGQD